MRALDDFVVVDAARKIGRIYRSPADDWFWGAKLDVVGKLMHGSERLANGESHASLARAYAVDPAAGCRFAAAGPKPARKWVSKGESTAVTVTACRAISKKRPYLGVDLTTFRTSLYADSKTPATITKATSTANIQNTASMTRFPRSWRIGTRYQSSTNALPQALTKSYFVPLPHAWLDWVACAGLKDDLDAPPVRDAP